MPEEFQRTSKQPADEATRFNQRANEEFQTRPESVNSGGADRFDLQPGSELGNKFVIECPVGRGGTSVIYRATDKVLQRRVAVKVVLPQRYVDKNTLIRFQREARAISRLDHPNIIKVLDFGLSDNGDPYLVMEWLDGEPLSAMIEREHFLPESRMLEISRQVADALSHAHDRQVLHRDLKPSNVFICWKEDGIQVKLLDFGIAKITDVDQKLTDTGEVVGSPLYMSPEQCVGDRLDVRSDIYSFGCCMYEMLAGTPPFMGASVMETLRMHMQEAPFQLTLARNDLAHGLELQSIVEKALDKNPAHRYQSVMDLRRDLSNVANLAVTAKMPVSRPVSRPSTTTSRTASPTPTSKNVRIALAILVVVLPVMLFAVAFNVVRFFIDIESMEHALYHSSVDKVPSARSAPVDPDFYITQEKDKQVREWFHLEFSGQDHFDKGQLKEAEKSFKAALALTERIPPNRQPPFAIATMDILIDVLQAQGSPALSQLSMQVKQREKYEHEHRSYTRLNAGAIDKTLEEWQAVPQLDSAAVEQLHAIAVSLTDIDAGGKTSGSRLTRLKRVDTLVRQYLSQDEDLRMKLDLTIGEACSQLHDLAGAQLYYNSSFDSLKRELASHPDVDLMRRAERACRYYLYVTPAKAVALLEAVQQGANYKTADRAYKADAQALDATVNAAFGCERLSEVEAQLDNNFGYGREHRWKIFFEFDAVKAKVHKAIRERQEALTQIVQALNEYNDAIDMAIKCDRSDIAARCSDDQHRVYFQLVRHSGSKLRLSEQLSLLSELRFAEYALPPYGNSEENQTLLLKALTDLTAGGAVNDPEHLKVRAEAIRWRRNIGNN